MLLVGGNENVSSPLNYGTPSSIYGSMRTPRSVVRNTPLKARPDILMDKRVRQLNVQSEVFNSTFYLVNLFIHAVQYIFCS